MNRILMLTSLLLYGSISAETTQPLLVSDPSTATTLMQSMSTMPMAFTKNKGQWPDSILFRASAGGSVMWFTKDGIYHQFFRKIGHTDNSTSDPSGRIRPELATSEDPRFECDSIETTMIKAEFVGANPNVEVVGLDEMEYKCNYFIGNVPSK